MRYRLLFCALAIAMMGASDLAADSKQTLKSLGESLTCQCGCNQTVTGCNHSQCSSREEMQALIKKEIDGGKAENTILQNFVLRYGVKVLSTPPRQGFNLAVWIMPAVGLIAGLVALILVARRWRMSSAAVQPSEPGSLDPKILAAMEEEMRRLELGGGDRS